MATIPRLLLRKGDDFQASVACTFENAAQDMSGWTLEAELAFSGPCAVPVALTVEWEQIATGLAIVSLPFEETADLDVGDHYLQIRATSPTGKKSSSKPITVTVRD